MSETLSERLKEHLKLKWSAPPSKITEEELALITLSLLAETIQAVEHYKALTPSIPRT